MSTRVVALLPPVLVGIPLVANKREKGMSDPMAFTEPLLRRGSEDHREYIILAVKGTGACPLGAPNAAEICKSMDHKHLAVKRYGYESASAWVTFHRNNGWHVVSMDRTY